jgi:hypothetical protein
VESTEKIVIADADKCSRGEPLTHKTI